MLLAFVGSFVGILLPAVLSFNVLELREGRSDLVLIIGSFGASAVLLYSSVVSDFAQPRSVMGGHVVSALVGVCVRKAFPLGDVSVDCLACALAVSLAIVAMNITRTLVRQHTTPPTVEGRLTRAHRPPSSTLRCAMRGRVAVACSIRRVERRR